MMTSIPSPQFTEEWFGEASQAALVDLYRKVAELDGSVVEVGCWEGRSTIALAKACHPDRVDAVDTWQGSPGEISADLASERDVFDRFTANTRPFGNVLPFRMDWRRYFAEFAKPIKFLHIDATHSYEEVRANIEAALPFLVPGAIVCGDDNHHPPVQQAVIDTLGDARLVATLWWWQKPTDLEGAYRRLCAKPSDIYQHLPTFVSLVEELDAKHVIELGTRTGVSTIAWLYALEKTGGRLTSVDIDERPAIGEYDHWTFVQGDDLDPKIVAALDDADIVFIDTSHLYDHTRAELNVYRHLVKPGGVIVLHDTMLEQPIGAPRRPRFPVRTAIEEFCASEKLEWTNDPRCWGLARIEVP